MVLAHQGRAAKRRKKQALCSSRAFFVQHAVNELEKLASGAALPHALAGRAGHGSGLRAVFAGLADEGAQLLRVDLRKARHPLVQRGLAGGGIRGGQALAPVFGGVQQQRVLRRALALLLQRGVNGGNTVFITPNTLPTPPAGSTPPKPLKKRTYSPQHVTTMCCCTTPTTRSPPVCRRSSPRPQPTRVYKIGRAHV